MGLGGISIWQLLIILAIIVMVFGTSRLRNMGSDLGSAIKGFRNSMSKDEGENDTTSTTAAKEESDSDKPAT
ncbi:MAG: twin-arginine translocase TatA/TatE family subunit [Proteobacteria bacterium]|jgi:sec-independent protein translocase protein TatA|nr:twin-arginine translocase TatA/TatE family subunit [Luminiphilus sp.]MDA0650365.1 twin-arginine translocase TatA/TatE family subunit [Pseudomonadota bacterium]